MTPTEARALADKLKERFGGTVPTSQAAVALRSLADQVESLEKAIQDCLAMANGRECEWGERAESAFAILYAAIDRPREAI